MIVAIPSTQSSLNLIEEATCLAASELQLVRFFLFQKISVISNLIWLLKTIPNNNY
jgi:hypothetical protein